MTKENAIKNLDEVITKIEFSRLQVDNHKIVQLVAISKYSTAEDVQKLYESGQRAFGENKVQDLKIKQEALDDLPIAWHFVGSLQKNKINNLIDLSPVLMHSLDSLDLAEDLDKKLKAKNKKMNCLLQVNSACEDSKSGFSKDEAIDMYHKIKEKYTNINLKGIMSIGAHSEDRTQIIESFKTTKNIFDNCQGATICSMGMSGDFEMAILEGSSMIRVGSALFK
ncbi:YggS family pyridoxal phosphate-dependent enzyme [Arcobacteraceae bacterium]|nr:YggS family pyridoxal phosphate-dependent enzyme [Arcobacteraceae bacterium]